MTNANATPCIVTWNRGDFGTTGLRRKLFKVVDVVAYAETSISKGIHLVVKFENGEPGFLSAASVCKVTGREF